jgi:hypothetical protein
LQKELRYLGHIVSPEGITTDSEKLKEVPTPKNKHEIRSYLSLCTYYGRFICRLANIVKPLTKLKGEKQAFLWTLAVETAYRTLKRVLYAALILAYRLPGEIFIFDTDAINVGIGGVLYQVQDGQERVITYYSKTLNNREKLLRYPTIITYHI